MERWERRKALQSLGFLDNRDYLWYLENIPFFDSPERELNEVYYYRWELVTKHMCYVSPETGYVFTEFNALEPEEWAGLYGSICCAAQYQFDDLRWLRNPHYARDYLRYWAERSPENKCWNYSWSLGWAILSYWRVTGDTGFVKTLYKPLLRHLEGWIKGRVAYPNDRGYDQEYGLYWNTGRDSGGEFNLASCQLNEALRGIEGYKIRGGAGYRPDINADQYGNWTAAAILADLNGDCESAARFRENAQSLKERVQALLWDEKRRFFMHRWRYDEYSEQDVPGHKSIRAHSFIWETNADRAGGTGFLPEQTGSEHGRECCSYLPWYYGLPDDTAQYATAWDFLMDPAYFHAPYGPTTAERGDPWFSVIYGECRWNGNSWPLNTSKVLGSMEKLLNDYQCHGSVSRKDYCDLLQRYAHTQHRDGKTFIAESHDPFVDQWTVDRQEGRHYFHSSFCSNVIAGLMGVRPEEGEALHLNPLFPQEWDYCALEGLRWHGRELSVCWDKIGERYGKGVGFLVFCGQQLLFHSPAPLECRIKLPDPMEAPRFDTDGLENYAANCDRTAYPRVDGDKMDLKETRRVLNGRIWYHSDPVNAWVSEKSSGSMESLDVLVGGDVRIQMLKVCFFEDCETAFLPLEFSLLAWRDEKWIAVKERSRTPLQGHAANTVCFQETRVPRFRFQWKQKPGLCTGIVSLELWGEQGQKPLRF